MTTELHAAAIVACTAIALAAVMVALAANRSGRYDGSTTAANRIHGHEIELHAKRLAELEGRLARLQATPAHYPPPVPPAPTTGAHDAHRARFIDTLTMPTSILTGGWRP